MVRAVGCIFGELLRRKPLLPGATEVDQIQKIFELLGPPTAAMWPEFLDLPLVSTLPPGSLDSGKRGTLFSKLPHLSPNVCADLHYRTVVEDFVVQLRNE